MNTRLSLFYCYVITYLLCGCKIQFFDYEKQVPVPLLKWDLNSSKKQELLQYICNTYNINKKDSILFRRFYYSPTIIEKKKYGLYYVSNNTHKGPIYVVNSRNTISMFTLGSTAKSSQDSVRIALNKHGNQLSRRIKIYIINNITN